jgi:Flp pilus assembly protein TadD
VDFDDGGYVFSNRTVMAGLTWKGLLWAFTTGFHSNWHPITWLSHMLDCSVFGVTPAGPHVMNVALHATDSVLLLVLLRRITGALWPSALVAALFAIHPAHVESVAWISERKDVLSTLFWLLTTLVYAQWTQERRPIQWLAVIWLFAMGLLTKPTLVTLPVTLLLLDVWPLERITWRNLLRPQKAVKLVVEKMPLFVMSAFSCAITVFVQRTAMPGAGMFSLTSRLQNVIISYPRYLGKLMWPANLCVLYPLHQWWPLWQLVGAFVVVGLITFFAVREAGRRPWLLFGWLFFIITLLPMIGLIQVGRQSHADRYIYVPSIGVFIVLAWGAREIVQGGRAPRALMLGSCAVASVLLALKTQAQASVWCSEEALFRQAAESSPWYPFAHKQLAAVYLRQGRDAEAEVEFRTTLRSDPRDSNALSGLVLVLARMGRTEEAGAAYRESIKTKSDVAEFHGNLGVALALMGRHEEAITELREALRLDPANSKTHHNLANSYAKTGRIIEAITIWKRIEVTARQAGMVDIAEEVSAIRASYELRGKPPR